MLNWLCCDLHMQRVCLWSNPEAKVAGSGKLRAENTRDLLSPALLKELFAGFFAALGASDWRVRAERPTIIFVVDTPA